MKTKAIITSALLSTAILAGTAYAENFKFDQFKGRGDFSCTIDAPDDAPVSIATHHILVKGPNCAAGVINITVKDLKQYAFEWKEDGWNPNIDVTVQGQYKNLYCIDEQRGRPEMPGSYCVIPTNK